MELVRIFDPPSRSQRPACRVDLAPRRVYAVAHEVLYQRPRRDAEEKNWLRSQATRENMIDCRCGHGEERWHMGAGLGLVRSCWETGMCQPLPPRTATQVRRPAIFKAPPPNDGQPETVGRRSATASFRHCCLIKWLSGNTSLGFSRYWPGGGLYSTFGH